MRRISVSLSEDEGWTHWFVSHEPRLHSQLWATQNKQPRLMSPSRPSPALGTCSSVTCTGRLHPTQGRIQTPLSMAHFSHTHRALTALVTAKSWTLASWEQPYQQLPKCKTILPENTTPRHPTSHARTNTSTLGQPRHTAGEMTDITNITSFLQKQKLREIL